MMKNLRKVFAALLCLAMLLSVSACGGDTGDNTAPEITGVKDQAVQAGTEFDALAGVSANDKEDGDVTSKIVITSMPSLDFKNGKATPANPGDYELTYTVTDKGGLEAKAYARPAGTLLPGICPHLEGRRKKQDKSRGHK